ncbi:MAG: hypothetical protein R3Y04_05855 [Rikenellaceae bacterium]
MIKLVSKSTLLIATTLSSCAANRAINSSSETLDTTITLPEATPTSEDFVPLLPPVVIKGSPEDYFTTDVVIEDDDDNNDDND